VNIVSRITSTSLAIISFFVNQTLYSQIIENPEHFFIESLYLNGEKKTDQAIEQLETLIIEYPDFFKAYRPLVEIYIAVDQKNKAIHFFEELLKKDPSNGYAYYALSRINYLNGDLPEAIENVKKSIALNPDYDEAYGPYGGLGDLYLASGDINEAIKHYNDIISKDPKNANAFYGLGRAYSKIYDWESAIQNLNKALQIEPEHKYSFHSLLSVYAQTGDYLRSLEYCQNLIDVAQKINDLDQISYGLSRIGGIHYYLGNYRSALNYFIKALNIGTKIGSKRRIAMAINNLGVIYAVLGDYSKAFEYFKQSLLEVRKASSKINEVLTLMNLGLILKDKKDYQQSLVYLDEALKLSQSEGFRSEEARIFTSLAEVYFDLSNFERSHSYYYQAKKIIITLNNPGQESYLMRNLGSLAMARGQHSKAITYFKSALSLAKEIKDIQIIWESHAGLGAAYEKTGEIKNAIRHLSGAIAIYDSIRYNLDFESLGQSFLVDKYEAYPSLIRLLCANNNYNQAFTILEKYKAKTLLKIMTQGQPLLNKLLPDSVRIKTRRINSGLERIHSQISQITSRQNYDQQKVMDLKNQVTSLELQKAENIEWIKSQYPSFYQVTSADPMIITDVQKNILHKNNLLIEYIVDIEKTLIFAISKDTLVYKEIDISRKDLEKMFSRLSALYRFNDSSKPTFSSSIFNAQMAGFSIEPLHSFYKLLVQPLEQQLEGVSNLIIVPDDLLYYLPFEAFVTDTALTETNYDFVHTKFLLEDYNISYAPSATVLNPQFTRKDEAELDLLAFGNPDYSKLAQDTTWNSLGEPETTSEYVQLPYSEYEVNQIGNTLGSSGTHIFTKTEASEKEFKARAGDYRVVHLATHFVLNDDDPLYSKVLLAHAENSEEDGFLQPYEIFNLQLKAELVVLSACNSAWGKLSKGEGLIGVSKAFQYAGVPALLVSQWNVDDKATGTIMDLFYEHLKEGQSKNHALRLAKLDYLKTASADHKDPFYWAPFILMGNQNPVALKSSSPSYYFYSAVLVLFIAGIFIWLRKKRKSVLP